MKWANAICGLTLALTLLAAPVAADEQQESATVRPPEGSTSLRPTSADGGGTSIVFGDPDDIIDGNRGRQTPPSDGKKDTDATADGWWEEILLSLLLQIMLVP